MALAQLFSRVHKALDLSLVMAYIHHGTQNHRDYRHQCRSLVKTWAEKLNIPFVTNGRLPTKALKSEAELREFRFEQLETLCEHLKPLYKKPAVLALAHHKDELLETQMLSLIHI